MNSTERQKYMTLKDEPPRSVGIQYATGEDQRNSSRKNGEDKPRLKWCLVAGVSGSRSKF